MTKRRKSGSSDFSGANRVTPDASQTDGHAGGLRRRTIGNDRSAPEESHDSALSERVASTNRGDRPRKRQPRARSPKQVNSTSAATEGSPEGCARSGGHGGRSHPLAREAGASVHTIQKFDRSKPGVDSYRFQLITFRVDGDDGFGDGRGERFAGAERAWSRAWERLLRCKGAGYRRTIEIDPRGTIYFLAIYCGPPIALRQLEEELIAGYSGVEDVRIQPLSAGDVPEAFI